MTRSTAVRLLLLLLVLLMIGTQIPGVWRNALEGSLHSPWPLAKFAHFCIFAVMAFVARVRPLVWPVRHVLLAALALGMLTEGLQLLVAIGRDASWADVAIDVAGAATGALLARLLQQAGMKRSTS